ncbi:MAG: response regulator [Proteobacteria bacterium]|nr:response regulator [Desulfobulbaceae bacterium]MBU4152447.1 response regulator [Pseudomonadota bacterium]
MKTVMVVDDNEANLYLMACIIKKMGCRILQARTGEEGVDLAVRERPDLIVMDIKLPGIDGVEATRRIRQSEACAKVPILAVTAHAMTGDRERFLQAGCNAHIEKPIDPVMIMAEIFAYLQ